eukprot:8881758-Pyramimonas_sp.AAC.1
MDRGPPRADGPLNAGARFPVEPAEASGSGKRCSAAAAGLVIGIHGRRVIAGRNEKGSTASVPAQVVDVE